MWAQGGAKRIVIGHQVLSHARQRQGHLRFFAEAIVTKQGPLHLDPGHLPARTMTMADQPAQRPGIRQRSPRPVVEVGAQAQIGDVLESALLAGLFDALCVLLAKTANHPQAHADRQILRVLAPFYRLQ